VIDGCENGTEPLVFTKYFVLILLTCVVKVCCGVFDVNWGTSG